MKRLRNLTLFFIVVLVLAISTPSIAFGLQNVYTLMHPAKVPCCSRPANLPYELQDVTFATSDGLKLYGWYVPPQNGAVIMLLHGRGGNRAANLGMLPMFIDHQYGVLTFDMRSYRQSDGDDFSYSWRDVAAAAEFLQSQPGVEQIGGIGFSLGANVIVAGAAHTPAVAALVADGTGPVQWVDMPKHTTWLDWLSLPGDLASHFALQSYEPGILAVHDALARISPRPVLLISGDDPSNEYELRVNQQLMAEAPASVTLWVVPHAGHVGGFAVDPAAYEARVIDFFNRSLLTSTTE
jgi:uncharacterized protein